MANSATVSSGQLATAAQYNNLRSDVVDTSSGHLHDGTNGRGGAFILTDTTAPLILKYDAGEYVTHAVSSAGVYSITTTDADSDSGAVTIDTILDIKLDSDTAANGIVYADGGTSLLRIHNSSSDVIIKPLVDAKDIIFQQYDGTEVARVEDGVQFNVSATTASTSATTGALITGGGLGVADDAYVGDDVYLISDSAVLGFGADKDTTLTHTDGSGLTLNSTNKIMFNDASQFIQGASATVLALGATDEIDLTATTIDINGAVAMDGAITGATNITLSGELDAATLDISGNADIDGTTNLDAVDIDGAVQLDATLTVGVDDTGYDVKLFGATSGQYLLWDESSDELVLAGDTKLSFHDAAGGENIIASADGHLEVNAGTTLDITAPTVDLNSATEFNIDTAAYDLNASGAVTIDAAGLTTITGTNDAAGAIYLRENAGTSGTIKIHADQGTSVTEGAESVTILSDAGGVGIRSTANLANAVNITVDGGTTSSMTLFNDQGTGATEGSASIQLLSDAGGINIKSGLNGANAILLTADGGTSETIVLHADQGTGTGSIELLSDAGGIELDAGTDIILDAGGADIFLKDDGTLFGTLTNNSGELLIKSSSSGTTAATFSGANVTFAGTVDATTDFTVGSTVITDDSIVMTPSTSDTVTIAAATNGALAITTVDNAAAAANIAVTADGTFEVDATTVTLDSAGDIVLDADGADIVLKDGGTTFGSLTNVSTTTIIKGLTRYIMIPINAVDSNASQGNEKAIFQIPTGLNGANLVEVSAAVDTAPTGAALTVMVHNKTDSSDMLSNVISIPINGVVSSTSRTSIIDTNEDDVVTDDIIRIDVDQVGSTEPGEGLIVTLGFAVPV